VGGPQGLTPLVVGSASIIDDVLCPGLAVVFCGMAAGPKAARERTPYVGPNNKFWPTLRRVGLIPPDFAPGRFRDLPTHGIGLTDIAKTQVGTDDKIVVAAADVALLQAKLRRYRPKTLAFVGKRAAAHFFGCRTAHLALGAQPACWEDFTVFVLPSTSALAHSHWQARPWRDLARVVRGDCVVQPTRSGVGLIDMSSR
jgi:TDG/mug DNA glycosylase family protein